MDLEITSTEAWRPVTAGELRANNRSWSTDEDTLLTDFLLTATRYVERKTQSSILGRTLLMCLPEWPDCVELPFPPLRTASAGSDPLTAITIQYRDTTGALLPAPAGSYRMSLANQVWQIYPGDNPLPEAQDHHRAVQITYNVGYRDAAHLKDTAPDLRDAIILLAASRDQNREATINEPRALMVNRKTEFGVDELLRPYRVMTRYSDLWDNLLS